MAGTGIAVVLVVVMIQIIYASTLMNVDSHQLADKEAHENLLKRMSDPFANRGGGCFNYEVECVTWAARGECNINPTYMHRKCQHACGTCPQNRRDVNENLGNSPPGTRDTSRRDLDHNGPPGQR